MTISMTDTTTIFDFETEVFPVTGVDPLLPVGPIIVATDMSSDSDAAFPLASVLAAQSGAEVATLSVLEPMMAPYYAAAGAIVSMDALSQTEAACESAVSAQIIRMVSPTAQWPVIIRSGSAAAEIASTADAMLSRLLVVGRGRHRGFDRFFGGENVLKIVEYGTTPVLAVVEGLTSLPKRVVIATDFSLFSLYAAMVALTVIDPDATVWLVHVGPPFDESIPFLKERADAYRAASAASFATMRTHLVTSARIENVVLTGSAPNELLRYLTEQRADLVVSATHGYGFIRRMILGSVAAGLVRNAPCSVLIVPGSARTEAEARALTVPNRTTRLVIPETFDTELAAFTLRNTGRFCVVEVNREEIGAQLFGRDLQFVGGTFDRHTNEVSIMFGTSSLHGMHLTHNIPHPTEIDVTSTLGGEEHILRIAHAGGQTLISMR